MCVCCVSVTCGDELEQRSKRQFMSMVLKTHSVNFLSLAEALYDSSRSRWLSSRRLWI